MADQTQFTTRIVISGAVDPSLAKSLGISEKAMLKLNELTTKLGSNNKVVAKTFMTFGPDLQKAQIQANGLGSAMQRVGTIVAGIGIADAIIGGLRTAIGLTETLGRKFAEFAHTSSEVSAQYELMKKGLGNILSNQPLADSVFEQEFKTAVKSPFQAKDLMQAVKRYVAAGMDINSAQWLASRTGDIVAGVGGGAPEMERAALVFGKMQASGHMSGQEARELKDLGIPYQKVLEKILGVDDAGLEKAQKKHLINGSVIMRMVEELTGSDGMFNKSMEKFATTFRGLETSIADVEQKFEADFGDIENLWIKFAYTTIGGPEIWDKVYAYMDQLKDLNQAVFSFVTSLPSGEVLGKFQPYFKMLQDSFVNFNKYIGSFFSTVEIPGQGNIMVLNATGEAKVKEAIGYVTDLVHDVVDFATNPAIQDLTAISFSQLTQAVGGLFQAIKEWAVLIDDLAHGNFGAAWQDLLNSAKRTGYTNSPGGFENTPWYHGHHISNNPNAAPWNIPHMASGGIVTSPTIGVIGESGPEAILPLGGESTLDDLATAINNLNSFLMNQVGVRAGYGGGGGVGAGYSGLRGGGSGSLNTIYGPGVAGDQPGQANYDWDSYHSIGHIHGKAYPLSAGSVAMHADYAEGVLHLQPGQWFTNPRNGKRQRWMDTSGSGNDQNIDEFVPGNASAHVHVTYNISTIEAKDVHRVVKEHAKAIRKHLNDESGHQAKINSKSLA